MTSAQDPTAYQSPGSTGPVGSTGSCVRVTQGKRPGLPGHMPTADRSSSAGEEAPALRLSVVVPTRNEAGNLCPLKPELDAALAGVSHEVIVVDDSTDDETRPLLQ